jgi:hypothetical protein
MQKTGWDDITVLAPPILELSLKASLEDYSSSIEQHDMALIKPLNQDSSTDLVKILSNSFIWGLDSI